MGCAFDSTSQAHEDVLAVVEPNQLAIAKSGHLSTEAKLSQATSILLQPLNIKNKKPLNVINILRIGCIMKKFLPNLRSKKLWT